jgi:hypothetical protein
VQGEGWFASGGFVIGATTGILVCVPFASVTTPVAGPGMHLLSAKVSSQRSPSPHRPRQGCCSQRPFFGLQTVPLVQIAMHPPALRSATAAPMAAAVRVVAPASVLGLPVAQAVRRTSRGRRGIMSLV